MSMVQWYSPETSSIYHITICFSTHFQTLTLLAEMTMSTFDQQWLDYHLKPITIDSYKE
ncbi:hypothetical protein Hanom_Chr17g01546651 [Helianthus anomalus]